MIAKDVSKVFTFNHFENAPLPVIVCMGESLAIQFANRAAFPLLKKSFAELEGKKIINVLPDIFSSATGKAIVDRCLVKSEAYILKNLQTTFLKDEKLNVTWYDVTIDPLRDDLGKPVGVICFFSEVLHRVLTAKSIEQSDAVLGSLFKRAPVALVCYRGAEFIVDFANDFALTMWGRKLDEVKGKPIYEIFPEVLSDPIINARHNESVERLKAGQAHIEKEVELVFMRNGKAHTGWYTYIHEPYTNSLGEIVGMLAIAIEVTDQVLARKKLQSVTDALPSLVSYVNNNEEYELVNKAYETWFNRRRTDVVGKTILQVVGKDAYRVVKPHADKALSGEADYFESWITYADGRRRFVSASYVPHMDGNNGVMGYVSLVNDLTERKMQEDALLERDARLGLIIDGVGAGTFDYDLESGDINWSPELKTLLGLPKDLVIDHEIAQAVVHADDLELVLAQSKKLRTTTGSYVAMDYRIVRRDNRQVRWFHSRSTLLFSELNGKRIPTRIIGFSIDITDQKVAEQTLRELSLNLETKVTERTNELSAVNDMLQQRNRDLHKTQSVLQQLIDSSVELIAVIDLDLKFLVVNKAFETFVHKSRSELIGKDIFVVYEGARGSRQVEMLEKVFGGETIHLRVNPSIARPNVWFDTHYVPLRIDGDVEGAIVLSRDITDIIKSERALADTNRQLKEAQRLAKLGSWEWDIATGTVIWSDEMYAIYGYEEKFPVDFVKATERMSREEAERSSRRTQDYIQDAVEMFRRNGQTVYEIPSNEIHIQLPNGENKLLRNTGKIHLTSEGKLYRFLGVLQDITQIRSVEEKLREVIEELKNKNRELESFNYIASHDLKEPLRNIRTMIDLIRLKPKEDTLPYLQKIDRAAERMSDLIQSILQLSEVSNREVQFSKVDLNKVVETSKTDLESRIGETRAEITSGELPNVSGNESQINQLFTNLLANSIKFCKVKPVITITSENISGVILRESFPIASAPQYWQITFSDNGIGFDQQFQEQIFEPFQRLNGRADYAGTGIGLSIVKKIVEKHNGFIKAESESGKGAKFIVWFPAINS